MKKVLGLVVVGLMVMLIFGCADDIVLEQDALLNGDYVGTYIVTSNFGAPNQASAVQNIEWTFTDKNYFMNIDVENSTGKCFCRVDGEYLLETGIRLKESHSIPDQEAGCNSCNDEENPEGTFRREYQGDTLVLKLQEATIFKEIRLVLKTDEPEE